MTDIAVLVADDEELERRALKKIIHEMNIYSIVLYEAENGREVLEQIQRRKIDIVLLDIKMPGLDGVKIAKQIKMVSPSTHIIFVTAFSEFDYAREAVHLGVEEYLVKPVSGEMIQGILDKVINQIWTEYEEKDSTILAEDLLQQEMEAAIGRWDLTNEKMEIYLRLREIKSRCRYLVTANLDIPAKKNRKLTESEENKARIIFKNGFSDNKPIILVGHGDDDGRFNSVIVFIEDSTEAVLQQQLVYLAQEIRFQLGISIHFTAILWTHGDIRNLHMKMVSYLSLTTDRNPVLMLNADGDLSLENPKGKIAKIVEYLREHLAQDVSLEEAAQVVGLSPFHVSHLFKSYQGETFIQVFTRLRVEAAKQFLKDDRYTIKEVCGLLGFKDQAYFSRVFKKREGMSPQAFQKQWAEDEANGIAKKYK